MEVRRGLGRGLSRLKERNKKEKKREERGGKKKRRRVAATPDAHELCYGERRMTLRIFEDD